MIKQDGMFLGEQTKPVQQNWNADWRLKYK